MREIPWRRQDRADQPPPPPSPSPPEQTRPPDQVRLPAGLAEPPPDETRRAENGGPGSGSRRIVGYAVALAGAAVATLALGLWQGGGLPDWRLSGTTGALTAWGLPFFRLAVDVSAVGTAGMLATCLLLPRTETGELSDTAYRCLRSTAWLALAWAAAAAGMLLFSWSDVTGLPVTGLPVAEILSGPENSFPEALPYLFCVALAMIIAVAAGVTQGLVGTALLLLLTGYNLLPLTTTGHAEHSRVTAYALSVHVIALALWVGGLAGLVIHVRRRPALLAVAVPRFSRLALLCFVAVAASGVTMAWVNLGSPGELWGSRYGLLVIFKATALSTLGIFGWWHRRQTVPAIAAQRSARAFTRLAAAETVIMAATVALAVALSRAPTPATTETPHGHAAGRPTVSTHMVSAADHMRDHTTTNSPW